MVTFKTDIVQNTSQIGVEVQLDCHIVGMVSKHEMYSVPPNALEYSMDVWDQELVSSRMLIHMSMIGGQSQPSLLVRALHYTNYRACHLARRRLSYL